MRYYLSILFLLALAGCKNGFYTEGDFPSVLKADAHVHINTLKGYFEEQAKSDNFLLLTLNVDVADSYEIEKQYTAAVESASKNLGRVFYSTTFHFDTAGWGTERWNKIALENLGKYLQFRPASIKLWKNIGMTVRDKKGKFIMVDDPRLDPVINYIIKKGLPVTGHLGEPRNCWLPLDKMTISGDSSYYAQNPRYHMYLHPDYPSYDDQINARDSLLAKHPDLVFIGCHLGSLEWNVDELAKRLDKYPNMAVDMAARICHLQYQAMIDNKKIRDFCIKYQDRLLYGTDLSDGDAPDKTGLQKRIHETWTNDWKFFVTEEKMTTGNFRGTFNGLHLPREVVDKIFYLNTLKWYKLKVVGK
jgi:predicted TIM-barrel fold metal-dependent hydrolase